MVVHDEQIGEVLAKLDELGITDNTIVMYSTDNGPENDTWPDGANTPYRGQKDTNWEGGWRVPAFLRWPGKIKPGSVLNGIVSHIDMFPTLLAIAGNPDVTKQLLEGCTVGDKKFNVHLDGYNMVPYVTGQVKESPRQSIFYFSDDGDVIAVRVGDYKFNLSVQRAHTMALWGEPFVKLRVPHICNLRRDPFERADFNSNTYWDWMVDHVPQMYLMQEVVAQQIAGVREVSAATEAGVVQPRRRDGAGHERHRQGRSGGGQAAVCRREEGACRNGRRRLVSCGSPRRATSVAAGGML